MTMSKKKEVIKIKKLEKGETFIKVTSPWMNPISSEANESPYDRVRWCAKALSTDEMRKNINCLFIDETYIAVTDGNRLHLTWNEYGYSPGLYHVLLCNKKNILLERDPDLELKDYPEFHKVIPYQGCKNGIKPITIRDSDRAGFSRFLYHVYTRTNMCFNMDLLKDALVPDTEFHFQTHKDNMLVMACEDFNRIALVMAFKM
jgi:hypothetical protein